MTNDEIRYIKKTIESKANYWEKATVNSMYEKDDIAQEFYEKMLTVWPRIKNLPEEDRSKMTSTILNNKARSIINKSKIRPDLSHNTKFNTDDTIEKAKNRDFESFEKEIIKKMSITALVEEIEIRIIKNDISKPYKDKVSPNVIEKMKMCKMGGGLGKRYKEALQTYIHNPEEVMGKWLVLQENKSPAHKDTSYPSFVAFAQKIMGISPNLAKRFIDRIKERTGDLYNEFVNI